MEAKVKGILSRVLGVDVATVGDDASADTISGWDSLAHLSIVSSLEESFDVEFSAEQMPNITSYEAIMKALDQLGVR